MRFPCKPETIRDVVGSVKTTVELEPALSLSRGNPALLQTIENAPAAMGTPRGMANTQEVLTID